MATTEDKSLIDLLTQLSGKARPHFEHYARASDAFGTAERYEWLANAPPPQQFEEVRKSVQTALENHPVLKADQSRFFGAKQLMIHPHYAALNLLKLALARGPVEAVSWLCKVYAIDRADLRYVVEVHGLKLDKQVVLSNGVRLMPLVQLPHSPHAKGLIAHYSAFPTIPTARPLFPSIAATFEVHEVCASTDFERSSRSLGPRSAELERTVRAFTLTGEASPIFGIGWLEFTDSELALADFGQMWMSPIRESDVGLSHPHEVSDEALEWVERYIQLKPDVKRVCDVAIERLALARRRNYPGNKAIEGAICLEALLLGDGGNQELTYRLRLRAALLLGRNLVERREISYAIRDFYDLRSKTVHGASVLPNEEQRQNTVATRGISICADALRAIVKLNKKYIGEEWELSGGYAADCNG
jgi:hypothetical protein